MPEPAQDFLAWLNDRLNERAFYQGIDREQATHDWFTDIGQMQQGMKMREAAAAALNQRRGGSGSFGPQPLDLPPHQFGQEGIGSAQIGASEPTNRNIADSLRNFFGGGVHGRTSPTIGQNASPQDEPLQNIVPRSLGVEGANVMGLAALRDRVNQRPAPGRKNTTVAIDPRRNAILARMRRNKNQMAQVNPLTLRGPQ